MQILNRSLIVVATILSIVPACSSDVTNRRYVVAPGAIGPYSGAVETGDTVWLSGKIGKPGGSFADQAESAIDAVQTELSGLGLHLANVVFADVFLTDMSNYATLNGIWERRFVKPYPARACVAVAALPKGAAIEIRVVASR